MHKTSQLDCKTSGTPRNTTLQGMISEMLLTWGSRYVEAYARGGISTPLDEEHWSLLGATAYNLSM